MDKTALPPGAKDTCAVIVTHHPDREFPGRLERIRTQVAALVIVDNGSGDAEVAMLSELAARHALALIVNGANAGVARALNIGIEHARSQGFCWVLLLDQDSLVYEEMAEHLFQVHASFPEKERLAVVGSGFIDVNRPSAEPGGSEGWREAETVITSGSLIPLATHARVGPFREEFFIDYVDSDYCMRARAKGFRVIKTRRPLMSHAIGAWTKHSVLGMDRWTSNHSPDRRYYIARNDTVMLREYGEYPSGLWALKSLSRRLRQCKRILLYEDMKMPKLIAVVQGYWDGLRGHLGVRGR